MYWFLTFLLFLCSFNLFHCCWGVLSVGSVLSGSVTVIPEQIDFKNLIQKVALSELLLTHCRLQPDWSRNLVPVSWQLSMPLSSADVRQLLESIRRALWASHREEAGVWWLKWLQVKELWKPLRHIILLYLIQVPFDHLMIIKLIKRIKRHRCSCGRRESQLGLIPTLRLS